MYMKLERGITDHTMRLLYMSLTIHLSVSEPRHQITIYDAVSHAQGRVSNESYLNGTDRYMELAHLLISLSPPLTVKVMLYITIMSLKR